MSVETLIQQISDEFELGWDESSQLQVLAEYIDNQMDDSAFERFVRQKAEDEANAGES